MPVLFRVFRSTRGYREDVNIIFEWGKLFSSSMDMVRSRNKLTENIYIPRESTRVFHAFFHIFTSENVENTSVLVYGQIPITT